MKNKKSVSGILILIILGVVFVSGCIQQEGDEADGQNGDRGIMPADLTQLTFFEEDEGRAVDPDWSPDGNQIVFCLIKESLESSKLYLIDADGTGLTEIGLGVDPSWSPVENKIIYGSNDQIYTMNSSGEDIAQLTTEYANGAPAWNPDGTKIVYAYWEEVTPSIWIMNSDGTGKTQLTTDGDGYCSDPSFSPDDSKIVYAKGFINPGVPFLVQSTTEIWVMDNNGSDKHAIYAPGDSLYFLHQRAWSKNNEIIFERIQWQKPPEIWVMNSDGTNPMPIVKPKGGPGSFLYADTAWDNTGTKIVTTQWKSAIHEGEETPEIFVNRNVVTFSLGE